VPKKTNLHKNEFNIRFFCSTSPLKTPIAKILKLADVSFDKLSFTKSVHTGENSQILTVSNKKIN
jgi:hypothetical protein